MPPMYGCNTYPRQTCRRPPGSPDRHAGPPTAPEVMIYHVPYFGPAGGAQHLIGLREQGDGLEAPGRQVGEGPVGDTVPSLGRARSRSGAEWGGGGAPGHFSQGPALGMTVFGDPALREAGEAMGQHESAGGARRHVCQPEPLGAGPPNQPPGTPSAAPGGVSSSRSSCGWPQQLAGIGLIELGLARPSGPGSFRDH